jgi:hypothetical protein
MAGRDARAPSVKRLRKITETVKIALEFAWKVEF